MRKTKERLGWPVEPPVFVPRSARERFREALGRGTTEQADWNARMASYASAHAALARELPGRLRGELTDGWDPDVPVFPADAKVMATRVAGAKAMNAIAPRLPLLCGGSVDLDPSTHTGFKGLGDFNPPLTPDANSDTDTEGSDAGGWGFAGRNMHFGEREHAMGAVVNGLAAHGFTGYGATFLIFSDHLHSPIRLAALMGLHLGHVSAHDSLVLGGDGPTHQPVEPLASLRAVPGLFVIRPCDANQTAVAWKVAVEAGDRPVLLALPARTWPRSTAAAAAAAAAARAPKACAAVRVGRATRPAFRLASS